MSEGIGNLALLRKLDSTDLVLVVAVLVLAWLAAAAIRWVLNNVAERVLPRLRLPILRVVPLARLVIGIGAACRSSSSRHFRMLLLWSPA
jgi:hypothetical protein